MDLKTKFDIKQSVTIKILNVIGRIIAIHISEYGLQYYVRYFDHASANQEYFYEDELAKA